MLKKKKKRENNTIFKPQELNACLVNVTADIPFPLPPNCNETIRRRCFIGESGTRDLSKIQTAPQRSSHYPQQKHGCFPFTFPSTDPGSEQPALLAGGQDSGSEEDVSSQTLPLSSAAAAATVPRWPWCHPMQWLPWLRTDVVRPLIFNYLTKAESCTSKVHEKLAHYLSASLPSLGYN